MHPVFRIRSLGRAWLVLALAMGLVVCLARAAAAAVAPTVSILNPKEGGLVGTNFKVQVQAWDAAAPVNLVDIDLDGANTYSYGATKNTNYNPGTGSAIWDYTFTSLSTGSHSFKARATSASGPGFSRTVSVTVVAAGTGDGYLLVRDNSSVLCMDCHALSAHSSQFTGTKYGNWETICRDCHTPHSTENIFLITDTINTPNSGPKAVQFRDMTGDAAYSYALSGATTPTNICQVCHTQTRNPSTLAARWRNTGNADTHFTAPGTQRCTNCHQHSLGFRPESPGNIDCTQCHATQWSPMNSSTTTYHMYMQNAGVTALTGGLGPLQNYPSDAQLAAGEEESQHRRCLMCHADMDIYSPSNNPSTPGRSYNLRTSILTAPSASDSTTYTNTDFRGDLAGGGICLSCHTNTQTKNTAKQKNDGTTLTPAWSLSDFSASIHNYTVPSTFRDGSTFSANCVKCHNDTLTKDNQTSAYAFGLHDSPYRRMLSPLGIGSPADPLEEQFCTQCHSGGVAGLDYYGVASMTAKARGIAALFGATRKHPIGSTSGIHRPDERETASAGWNVGANRHVECEDCHNPHAAKAGTHTPGSNLAGGALTGIWGVSITGYITPTVINQQDNLQDPSALTYGRLGGVTYESELCLKCHSYYAWTTSARPNVPSGHADGSTAQVTDQAAEFNPNNLAHHAIMGPGKNQPIQVGQASYYNPSWPAFKTGTVSTSGTAVTFSSPLPFYPQISPVNWYLYIGPLTNLTNPTCNSCPPRGSTAWYQIASVTDSTHVTLTASAGNQTSQSFYLTAGLGNTFVPPYGPWSNLTCSDCHGSNVATDPGGPHGSAARWILKEAISGLSFPWWNGTSVVTVTPNNVTVGGSTSASATPAIFCFNCHRRDVYGDENLAGNTATYANLGRVSHDPTAQTRTFQSATVNNWGILCMNCHGGGGLGVIHGTNAGKGFENDGTTPITATNSFRGKRFLYGATWTGVRRATFSAAVTCWTKNSTDTVNVCTQGHNPASGRTANYDYESGVD